MNNARIHSYFTTPEVDSTQKPINLSNNEKRSQCIFFCNESEPSWLVDLISNAKNIPQEPSGALF